VRSYSSTLIAASRIALFFPIFILTASTGLTSVSCVYMLLRTMLTAPR
jgi:hypothetical protein